MQKSGFGYGKSLVQGKSQVQDGVLTEVSYSII